MAAGPRVLSREVWRGFLAFLDLAAYSSHTNRTRGRRGIQSTCSFGLPFLMKRRQCTIVFLGIDNAGKTTLMGKLKGGTMIAATPTGQPSSEQLTLGNITFTAYDLGGHKQVRRVWETYLPVADAVLFIVDGTDRKRLPEARDELNGLLSNEAFSELPIAIFVNKIDCHGACGESEIINMFEIWNDLTGKKDERLKGRRPLELFFGSVVEEQGYGDAFQWLAKHA